MKRTLLLAFVFTAQLLQAQIIGQYTLRINPDQDAHYALSGTGRGFRSALKFDISSIPQGATIKAVELNAFILGAGMNWNGNVDFYNLNNQVWTELDPADSLQNSFFSDSTHQDSLFGNVNTGWTRSVDLTNIFMRDYNQKNNYCTVFMVDPDDQNALFTPGTPLFDRDSLVVGDDSGDSSISFYSSESPALGLEPYLGIRYCFPTDTMLVITACDSIELNGETFNMTGMYTQVIQNSQGCDSTIHIDLTINHSSTNSISDVACDSLRINGELFTESGTYKQVFVNAEGCDSILTLNLIINKSKVVLLQFESCDSVVVNGQVYKVTGAYVQNYMTAAGCDSILVIEVVINTNSFGNLSRTACDSIEINNEVFTMTGVYTQILVNAKGCDSILVLNLTINHSNSEVLSIEDCDLITVNGQNYTKSGQYFQKFVNSEGCDSILILELIIHQSTVDSLSYNACNSIVINGQTYSTTGIYNQKLTGANGCDSVLVLDITINSSTAGSFSVEACDSITLNNQKFDSSGVYNQLLTNANGCDSLLVLTVLIKNSSSSTLTETACDSTRINNELYTESGTYIQTFTNSENCDSLLIINLTVHKGTRDTLQFYLCDTLNINNQFIDSAGYYVQNLNTAEGCDSVLVLNVEKVVIDTTITKTANSLMAIQSGASYQWVDCDKGFEPVSGATEQEFIPTSTSNYAVIITLNGCTDTSFCLEYVVVSTENENKDGQVSIFPNPSTDGRVMITSPVKMKWVKVLNTDGRLLHRYDAENKTIVELDFSQFPSGIYILECESSTYTIHRKWIRM